MATVKASRSWRESDFERWFVKHLALPSGERLFVVAKHRPIKHEIDLVCLDTEGGLVIVEVKNEQATRRMVAQALEYIAEFDGATLGDLAEEHGDSVRAACCKWLGPSVKALSSGRRVILAAPGFDASSAMTVRWLNEALKHKGVEFSLLEVTKVGSDFQICPCAKREFVRAHKLPRGTGTAIEPRGRRYFVLEPGPKAILWHMGRVGPDGHIQLPSTAALSKRGVRISNRYLAPNPAPGVDISQCGTCWKHRDGKRTARLLGIVTGKAEKTVVFVRVQEGKPTRVRRRESGKFHREWKRVEEGAVQGWRQLAAEIKGGCD